jgi:hypothetical protein
MENHQRRLKRGRHNAVCLLKRRMPRHDSAKSAFNAKSKRGRIALLLQVDCLARECICFTVQQLLGSDRGSIAGALGAPARVSPLDASH